jgi:hypothetical protein
MSAIRRGTARRNLDSFFPWPTESPTLKTTRFFLSAIARLLSASCEARAPNFPHARSVSSNQQPAPCKPVDPKVSVEYLKLAATPSSPKYSS